jgi:hypothetical protein
MWASYENTSWTFDEEASRNRDKQSKEFWQCAKEGLAKLDKGYYIMLWLLAMAGLIAVLTRRKMDLSLCLFALAFAAYFMMHIVVEMQTRYRYFAMPFVCIIAAQLLMSKSSHRHPARR